MLLVFLQMSATHQHPCYVCGPTGCIFIDSTLLQRQSLPVGKSPRSTSQRVASPRKRQCSGASYHENDNGVVEEHGEDAEALADTYKKSSTARVDLQAVAAGL